ncbi:hypothetical protein RJ639_020625 [Escallonia herrerae]|uniref:Uncharacterized protein n=1 Tax=Escallonia herrerae TaxID=1293975 RepID=A0AA88V514_9ASTE|nr:hypothetical protein RJ639_020625 [Escallonia herrerae]
MMFALLPSRTRNLLPSHNTFLSFSSSLAQSHHFTSSSSPTLNPVLFDYLVHSLGLPNSRALSICSQSLNRAQPPEHARSVVQFLKRHGFSDPQIRSTVSATPVILFCNIDKILKPKLRFFQRLGITGPDLGKFVSKNSTLLSCSLRKKLKPRMDFLNKYLSSDDWVRLNGGFNLIGTRQSRLVSNISYLESFGISGSRLSALLRRQPRVVSQPESQLRESVAGALEMGFSADSKMFIHALAVGSPTKYLFRKLELFRSLGFLEAECMEMFRKAPILLATGEEKLRIGVDFFMNTVKCEKTVLIRRPVCLMFSLEGRVIPRYRVIQILKAKRLLKKDSMFYTALFLGEKEFLKEFVLEFRDDAEELMIAYKGHTCDTTSQE